MITLRTILIALMLAACEVAPGDSIRGATADGGDPPRVAPPSDAAFGDAGAEDASLEDGSNAADGGEDGSSSCSGELDPGFGTGGIVFFLERVDGELAGLAVDPSDRIVAAASLIHRGVQFGVLRFDAAGVPDPGFGIAGVAHPSIDPFLSNQADVTALLLADGGIVTVGTVQMIRTELLLMRQLEDGRLDPSFGVAGRTRLTLTSSAADTLPNAASTVATGAFDIAGVRNSESGTAGFLARFRTDGSLDGAHRSHVASDPTDRFAAIVSTPDLGAITAGSRGDDLLLVKTSSSGDLDPAFGSGGVVLDDRAPEESASAAILDAMGRLVVAGWAGTTGSHALSIRRYQDDGSPDLSFGVLGAATATVSAGFAEARDLLELSDGRLLVAGWATDFNDDRPLIAFLFDDGSIDRVVMLSVGTNARATRTAVAHDGAILLGGVTSDGRGFIARVCR